MITIMMMVHVIIMITVVLRTVMMIIITMMILMINNGNRTECSPIRSVIIRVINKIGRPRSWSLICESRVWLQTQLDETKSCCQLIITVTISENNKHIKDKYLR